MEYEIKSYNLRYTSEEELYTIKMPIKLSARVTWPYFEAHEMLDTPATYNYSQMCGLFSRVMLETCLRRQKSPFPGTFAAVHLHRLILPLLKDILCLKILNVYTSLHGKEMIFVKIIPIIFNCEMELWESELYYSRFNSVNKDKLYTYVTL